MPETPNFDQIAKSLLLQVAKDLVQTSLAHNHVVEQLRLIWNARGAADLATIDATITYTLSMADAGLMKQLDRAIRILDR